MFDTIVQKVRGWLYNMGLISGVRSISQTKKGRQIIATDEHYAHVAEWLSWYQGYVPKFHNVVDKTPEGEQPRRKYTLGMAKVVCHEMATLVFNEKCSIVISDSATQEFIDGVLEDNDFVKTFQHNLEYGFALGGFVPRPYFDGQKIKIAYSSARDFFPLSTSAGRVTEGVCVTLTLRGQDIFTLLEWHTLENGGLTVTSELYRSRTQGSLGVQVALAELYPDLAPVVHLAGADEALLPYIKPSDANNFDIDSALGISIFANALDTLRMLDNAFDSFNLEFTIGRKRILVPAYMLRPVVDPETGKMVRYFDTSDSVYEGMNMDDKESKGPVDISAELRVEEHVSAINALLNILAMKTGFSSGTFSFDGKSVKTATEVVSENSKTFRTKNAHENSVEEGIKELIRGICTLADQYGVFHAPDFDVTVSFDDSVAETRNDNAAYYSGLTVQGLLSKQRAIMKIFDVPREEALKILDEIKSEQAQSVDPAIADLIGGTDGGGAASGQPTA